jgi:hypothetical protein
VSHHTYEASAKCVPDLDEPRIVGRYAGTMAVAVDLDQRLDCYALRIDECANGISCLQPA